MLSINNLYIFRVTPDTLKAAVAGVNVRKKVYVGWKHYNRNYFRAASSAKGGRTKTITRKSGQNIGRLLNRKIILIEKWKTFWDVRQNIRGMST